MSSSLASMATNGNTNEEKKDDMLSPNSDSSNESSSSSSSRQQQKRLPVDRDWILKLLKKYPNPNTRNTTKALVVAPMVDQSDLPFRLLCRRYGANLCYTPMIHARLAVTMKGYREKFLGMWLSQLDRPLIAQLCGSDPDIMLQAARLVEPYVDGIDINCGCPQGIARRGFYGAFLLESENTLIPLVEHLSKHLTVPLSVKVRLLPAPDRPPQTTVAPDAPSPGGGGQATEGFDIPAASLELYGKLIKAGVHLLTIHGRTRKQKQDLTGRSDWKTIAKAVEMYGHLIPIFANGSIYDYHDVEECLQQTGVDGVMSSEAILEYPALFYRIPQEADLIVEHPVDPDAENDDQKMNQQQHSKEEYQLRQPISRRTIGRLQLAKEYMELAKEYPPEKGGQGTGLKCIRAHIHHILHKDLQEDFELRRKVVMAKDFSELEQCVVDCQEKHQRENHVVAEEHLSWYVRHRPDEKEKEKQRSAAFPQRDVAEEEDSVVDEDDEGYQECLGSLFTEGEVCGDNIEDY